MRTICALIIGLVLVMFPNEAGDYFVITIGVVFLIPALLSIIGYFAMSAEERRRLPIEGIGSLLFGLWLIIMPGFFADLLTFVLGFILVLGGVQQIASLSAARRWMPVRVGFYIIPVLILIAGLLPCSIRRGCVPRLYHYRYQQHSICSFRIDKLVTFTRKRPKAPGTPGASSKAVDNIEDAEIIEDK